MIELIAPVLCVLAVGADAWTTYQGVYVKKVAVEANPTWFTKPAWHLVLQPAIALILPACSLVGTYNHLGLYLQIGISALSAVLGTRRGVAAFKNFQINKAK